MRCSDSLARFAFETENTVMATAFVTASVAGMKCGIKVWNEKRPLAAAVIVQGSNITQSDPVLCICVKRSNL